jgi:hypothetical protein
MLDRIRDAFTPTSTRLLRDQAAVEGNLPAATRYLVVEGVRGWLYPISTELGDEFQLFVWFDGSAYQVKVVEPEVERRDDPHACHLLPDGRICLGEVAGGGMPTLVEAYARSVIWCNGYSVYTRNSTFPF